MLDFNRLEKFKPKAIRIIEMIPVWAHAHEVDEQAVMKQIPIAYAWCEANKDKAPKKNLIRFLNSWMANAKKFGNLTASRNSVLYKESLASSDDLLTYEDIQSMKGTR